MEQGGGKGLLGILTEDAHFKSALEDGVVERLRRAKDFEEAGTVLNSMWKTHPCANKLRSRLRALILKMFPSLTAAFNLSRCAMSISFDLSLKRGRPDSDDGVGLDAKTLPAIPPPTKAR